MVFDYEFLLRVRAPTATVFEKLLRIEHLARWFCGWCRIEPKVGGKFQFGGETCLVLPEGRGWETTIDEGETLRRFAFTWPVRGTATRVAYELEAAGDSTRLRARHTGVPLRDSTCGTMQDAWRMSLGNLKSIAEGRGDSVRPDHTPVTTPELHLSTLIEAPPERIFTAFTDASQLDRWTTGGVPEGKARVDPHVGGTFLPGRGDGPGRILEIERDTSFVLEWPQPASNSRIDVRMEAKSSGTAVYLAKSGYRGGDTAAILKDRGGWSDLLVCLKNFVEGGDAGFANAYDAQVRES